MPGGFLLRETALTNQSRRLACVKDIHKPYGIPMLASFFTQAWDPTPPPPPQNNCSLRRDENEIRVHLPSIGTQANAKS